MPYLRYFSINVYNTARAGLVEKPCRTVENVWAFWRIQLQYNYNFDNRTLLMYGDRLTRSRLKQAIFELFSSLLRWQTVVNFVIKNSYIYLIICVCCVHVYKITRRVKYEKKILEKYPGLHDDPYLRSWIQRRRDKTKPTYAFKKSSRTGNRQRKFFVFDENLIRFPFPLNVCLKDFWKSFFNIYRRARARQHEGIVNWKRKTYILPILKCIISTGDDEKRLNILIRSRSFTFLVFF